LGGEPSPAHVSSTGHLPRAPLGRGTFLGSGGAQFYWGPPERGKETPNGGGGGDRLFFFFGGGFLGGGRTGLGPRVFTFPGGLGGGGSSLPKRGPRGGGAGFCSGPPKKFWAGEPPGGFFWGGPKGSRENPGARVWGGGGGGKNLVPVGGEKSVIWPLGLGPTACPKTTGGRGSRKLARATPPFPFRGGCQRFGWPTFLGWGGPPGI